MMAPTPTPLPCGCVPHVTRPNDRYGGLYCETEGQAYCNFECPHDTPTDETGGL